MTIGESSTTRDQNISLQCPKLTETNYTTWAIMMETIMKAYGIWETIVAKEGEAINEKKENTSKAMIFQTFRSILNFKGSMGFNQSQVFRSQPSSKARLQTLRSELETSRMKANEKVSYFGGKLSGIKAKFKVLVRKLLNSIPKKFLPIVATIEQCQDLDKMTFEEAIGRLTAFEERLKSQDEHEENYQEKLLMASSSNQRHGRRRGRNFNKEDRNFNKGERGRGRDKHQGERDKKDMKCYNCNNYGHLAYECTKWKEKDKNEESLLAYYSDEDPKLL